MKKYYIILIAFLGCLGLQAKDMTGLKIYINPGHGGYDSDDRNVAVYPYAQGDTLGFWESSSNLHKGLMLRELLQEQGATVAMSRVLNRTEDDRGLETIGREASEWEADLFFSIHSNATGTSRRDNFPMMLFRGYTENPVKPEDKVAAKSTLSKTKYPIGLKRKNMSWAILISIPTGTMQDWESSEN